MLDINNYIRRTSQYSTLSKEIISSPTHAYMLVGYDNMLMNSWADLISALLLCPKHDCTVCNTCKKIALHSHPDMILLPATDNVLVEDINFLIDNAYLVPMESTDKVFVINNFSSANIASQNKLLKILEEPPASVHIILLVDNESTVLPTIFSRCRKINITRLDDSIIRDIVIDSNKQSQADSIVELSDGSLTTALSLLTNNEAIAINDCVFNVLTHIDSSSTVIAYSSSLLQYKNSFKDVLEVMEQYHKDLLMILMLKDNLVTNKSKLKALKELAQSYSPTAIDLIIKKIYYIKKQLKSNCSVTSLSDNLLLSILEVKKKCSTM